MSQVIDDFIENYADLRPDPFCPEIQAYNARDLTEYWKHFSDTVGSPDTQLPYWAIVWPGGRALARYILDHPLEFRSKRVLDLGAGSGIASIAAKRVGAYPVCIDIDRTAIEMAQCTAKQNNVTFPALQEDVTLWVEPESGKEQFQNFDIVMAGDVFYESDFSRKAHAFLRKALERGLRIIISDPDRHYQPKEGVITLAFYQIPTVKEIEGISLRDGRILEMVRDSGEKH